VPKMPDWFKEALMEAFYYNDTDEIIYLNQVWRQFLEESYSITLKG
jgi:hypothetical protein